MNTKGIIFSIQRYSLHDGPGIRTTVFLKGCPLNCVWCHNPESKHTETELLFASEKCVGCGKCVAVCPSGARSFPDGKLVFERRLCTACGACAAICPVSANEIKGELIDVDSVMKEVEKDRLFYDTSGGGMTLSGGEPAMQKEFSLSLLCAANRSGIGCAVETSGAGDPSFYKEAAAHNTLFLYDIKALDDKKHREFCGASNKRSLSNLELLFSLEAKVILRLPLIPGYNDDVEDLRLLKNFLTAHREYFTLAEIMPYHNLGTAKEKRLGLTPRSIDSGEKYTDTWLRALSGDGYQIQLANI